MMVHVSDGLYNRESDLGIVDFPRTPRNSFCVCCGSHNLKRFTAAMPATARTWSVWRPVKATALGRVTFRQVWLGLIAGTFSGILRGSRNPNFEVPTLSTLLSGACKAFVLGVCTESP